MPRRPLHLFLSALGWAGFNLVVVWTMAFLADVVVPRTVDGPHRVGTALAVGTDVGLFLLFAVQHSVMARRQFKAWLRRRIPVQLERAVYVLATDAVLVLLLLLWQPFGGEVWHLGGAAAVALWVLYAAGWALAIAATFAVDHFELVGLRQAGWLGALKTTASTTEDDGAGELHVGGLHALVRHPLMTGLLVTVWATPHMGAAHLLYALSASAYIALGLWFEERDLRRTFGSAYDEYATRVPALLPLPTARRHALPARMR